MVAYVDDKVLDGALNYIKTNGAEVYLSASTSNDYAELTSATNVLGKKALSTGDYAIADGTSPSDGRKITVTPSGDVDVTKDGTLQKVAIIDTTNSDVLLVFDVETTRTVTTSDKVSLDDLVYAISKGL